MATRPATGARGASTASRQLSGWLPRALALTDPPRGACCPKRQGSGRVTGSCSAVRPGQHHYFRKKRPVIAVCCSYTWIHLRSPTTHLLLQARWCQQRAASLPPGGQRRPSGRGCEGRVPSRGGGGGVHTGAKGTGACPLPRAGPSLQEPLLTGTGGALNWGAGCFGCQALSSAMVSGDSSRWRKAQCLRTVSGKCQADGFRLSWGLYF